MKALYEPLAAGTGLTAGEAPNRRGGGNSGFGQGWPNLLRMQGNATVVWVFGL